MALTLEQLRGNHGSSIWRVMFWDHSKRDFSTLGVFVTETDAFEAVVRQQQADRHNLSIRTVDYYTIQYTMVGAHVSTDPVRELPPQIAVLTEAAVRAMRS